MKTHSIRQQAGERRIASVSGVLAICGALLLGATTCSSAMAQSGASAARLAAAKRQGGQSAVRQIAHGNEAFRVVSAADVQTAADNQDSRSLPQPAAQVSWTSPCSSCGTGCGGTCGSTYGDCGSCGGACRGNCGSGYSPFSGFGNPCAPCRPYCYAAFDALYMDRDGKETLTLSPNFRMDGFDQEIGGRITIGRVPNCVDGYEATFTGLLQWDMAGTLNVPGGNILTFLTPGGTFVPADLSAFNDTAVLASQAYEAEYWSVEGNKSLISWDFAKLLYGIRYAEYDEDYVYASRNNAGQTGLLASSVKNRLIGIQGGLDLLYPISRHAFTDFRSRIGAFVNFADTDFGLINDGSVLIANSDSEEALSAIIEIGGGVRYQLGQMLAVRAGVELWYLSGIAAANEQFSPVLTPLTGLDVVSNDDFLVTGISLGAELRY